MASSWLTTTTAIWNKTACCTYDAQRRNALWHGDPGTNTVEFVQLLFADMFLALLLGTASAMLDFAPPVTLPLACPQALCRYGGTTTAEDRKSVV